MNASHGYDKTALIEYKKSVSNEEIERQIQKHHREWNRCKFHATLTCVSYLNEYEEKKNNIKWGKIKWTCCVD